MKQKLINGYLNCTNPFRRQRIRKVLRVRYGILITLEKQDPVWLSAHN
jgi:hypothetical protein